MFAKFRSFLFGNLITTYSFKAGWFACEQMVCKRIKENYPDTYQEVWEKLVQ